MFKRPAPRLLRAATVVALSLWLALGLTPTAGGTEPALQIGYVRGRLVHLRSVPPQDSLQHDTVLTHLMPGEAFVTDGVRTGISHTGEGPGQWFHVYRLNDPSEKGWISAEYLVLVPGTYLPNATPESFRAMKEAHDVQQRGGAGTTIVQNNEVREVHNVNIYVQRHSWLRRRLETLQAMFAPLVEFISNIATILDTLLNLVVTFFFTLGLGRLILRKVFGVGPIAVAAAIAMNPASPSPSSRPRKPHHLYFDNFYIPNP
jgi:hypothetical protein